MDFIIIVFNLFIIPHLLPVEEFQKTSALVFSSDVFRYMIYMYVQMYLCFPCSHGLPPPNHFDHNIR